MINSFRNLSKQLSPGQKRWVATTAAAIVLSLLMRYVWKLAPSIVTSSLVAVTLLIAVGYCMKLLTIIPTGRRIRGWLVLILLGGILNFSAVLANRGFMPCTNVYYTYGVYCPLDSARLSYLGDWLYGFVSPGDIIMLVSFIGAFLTMVKGRKKLVSI